MRTQFITDKEGRKISAVLPIKEYERIMEQLEELDCIKAYDKAKRKNNKKFVPLKEAFRQIEKGYSK